MGNCISSLENESYPNGQQNEQKQNTFDHEPSVIPETSPRDSEGSVARIIVPKAFKFKDLGKATDGFSERYLLGEGSFGKVYRGKIGIRDGRFRYVAIKRMEDHGSPLVNEWLAEILILGRLSVHPNLVYLEGYCLEEGEHMLVYEYMSNGSIDHHLFQDRRAGINIPQLTWQTRFCIALDAARGLAHLHRSEVIHRDFRSSNILLDKSFKAKLSDFGLAKSIEGQTHVTSIVSKGAEGYLCPRFQETGFATIKVDVYAFGIVLLELITGRRAKEVDNHTGRAIRLLQWAGPIMTSPRPNYRSLMDPYLPEPFPIDVVRSLARLVRACVNLDPISRPEMDDMVKTLESMQDRFDIQV